MEKDNPGATRAQEGGADYRPLADRMRPAGLEGFFGQSHLLAPGKPLRRALDSGQLHSMVLWGPPGTGKTTLARIIAERCEAQFLQISAVLSGVKDIRAAVDAAENHRQAFHQGTVLFVDEAHRFNKSQQDAFLPHVERGTVTFIGATTENPAFELNNALLSRVRVYVLKMLDAGEIGKVIDRALLDPAVGLGNAGVSLTAQARDTLITAADGDARRALGLLELAADMAEGGAIDARIMQDAAAGGQMRRFDKGGDVFYDQISALHKSVRGSAPDAALYWFARMIDGGCDPLYIARRVVRMASEDIGNADPRALALALDAWHAQERLGSPEGELGIAQAIVYLACAPKSNAVYQAWNAALEDAAQRGSAEVPLHLRNAPTRLAREGGHGAGYRYAHDEPGGYAPGVRYFPDGMEPRRYYDPPDRGLEARIREKLEQLRALDAAASGADPAEDSDRMAPPGGRAESG